MGRKVFTMLILPVVWSALTITGGDVAWAGGIGGGAQENGVGDAAGGLLCRIGGLVFGVDDFSLYFEEYGRQGKTSRREVFDGFVNDRLLAAEARSRGYGERRDVKMHRAILEETLLSNKFLESVVYPAIQIRDEEIAQSLPPGWEQIRLDLLLLQRDADVEAAKRVIEVARSLDEVEAKLGTGSAERAGEHGAGRRQATEFFFRNSDFFPKDEMDRLFSLEKGALAGLVQSPVGTMVVVVADKRILPEAEQAAMVRQVKDGLHRAKLNTVFNEYLKRTALRVEDARLRSLADASSKEGRCVRAGDEVVAAADGREFTFGDVCDRVNGGVFVLYKTGDVAATMMREEIDRIVLAGILSKEAREFGISLTDVERRGIEQKADLYEAKLLVREAFKAVDPNPAEFDRFVDGLKKKFNFWVAPESELSRLGVSGLTGSKDGAVAPAHGR